MPNEEFIGLYCVSETTCKGLARVPQDVLLRLHLAVHGLRGQTHDRAASSLGNFLGYWH